MFLKTQSSSGVLDGDGHTAHSAASNLVPLVVLPQYWRVDRPRSPGRPDGPRIAETDEATREGRVYVVVVACTPRLVKSALQARKVGKDILMWLGKECAIFRLLPEGMVHPKERTEEHVQTAVGHWREHGELSTVAKRATALGWQSSRCRVR